MTLRFQILARHGAARLGRMTTPHGVVETPAFMPVATLGAVKGLGPHELGGLGASLMLSNLYHLALRPGVETIGELGGLHRFTGWEGPILTDSGGYQVFSLARRRKLDAGGVTFRSHVDGREIRFTPRGVVEMQSRLGVDIGMMLDECPPWPVDHDRARESLARTGEWARRSRDAWSGGPMALFGIVQGSFYRDLRERAAREIVELDCDGHAIGGVSVGEERALGERVVEWTAPLLPAAKPRYLMGLGTPLDILHGVRHGIDLFDCVLPARNGRHGVLFTRDGVLRIKNARFAADPRPLDPECECPTCRRVHRAFLHHLFRCGELTAPVLATLHNLRFYLDFMAELRQSLRFGSFAESTVELARRYTAGESPRGSAVGVQPLCSSS